MAATFQSEIRHSEIRELLARVKKNDFGLYLRRIRPTKVRAFVNEAVEFDFPVTALIGTNGGGKSTVLGGSAIAYKIIKPAVFFPKSSLGDDSMSSWSIGYDIIEKAKSPNPIARNYRFKNYRWVRDDVVERTVLNFGITRTVPAGERTEFKRIASAKYKFLGKRKDLLDTVKEQVARILGKDIAHFQRADIKQDQSFYVGGDGNISYSEFHFGAGESSVIRMVTAIEAAPKNSLVLIEEIENGLHPVAVRKMVEYLIDVAARRSIQSIFTTHSEDALLPLPPEGVWYAINGKIRQGRISIEALRAISGRIEQNLAIFVEDDFAKDWVTAIVRDRLPDMFEQIGVYAVSGEGQAHHIHKSHSKNPSISDVSIKTLSSKTKAIWAVLTVAGSVVAAIISTTTYINGFIADISNLKKQVADISEQIKPLKDQLEDVRNLKNQVSVINDELRPVNGRVRTNVDYNGSGYAACDPGSFLTGLSISVNDHFNSHGQIECSRVQPIGR